MRVLISQARLAQIAGSEVLTYELAAGFRARGDDVVIATHHASAEWFERFGAMGIPIHNVNDPALHADLVTAPIDLAWIHHQVIPEPLLTNPGRTRFVFQHMSHMHPLEFPVMPEVERRLADLVLFPAAEGRDAHREHGLLDGIDPAHLRVFGNPAPDAFGQVTRTPGVPIRSVLVVSNHLPVELRAVIDSPPSPLSFTVRGMGDDATPTLLTPEDLAGVDAVVSIGKTVQYALVSGTPVFCYDHFGGPGWLSPATVDRAAHHNFSGRGFDPLTAGELASALVDGAAQASIDALQLRRDYAERFTLSTVLDRIVAELADRAVVERPAIPAAARTQFLTHQRLVGTLIHEATPRPQPTAPPRSFRERLGVLVRG